MTRRRKAEAGPEPNLPVTPMLDMAFQLLAFFVMTYHPSNFEGQMDLSLPSEPVSQAAKAADVKPSQPDPDDKLELKNSLTVVVRTNRDSKTNGLISGLSLQDTAGTQQVNVPATNPDAKQFDPQQFNQLRDELKKRRETAENKDAIKVQADAKVKLKEVFRVMDVCRQAGFSNIGFVHYPRE